mmetsp:Transcript_15906/g.19727  ORF Transcript_15906/g.19727 Transcript_15906/m.19727 type:complete len:467 (-) Transcript_15906:222-1622(-)
MDSAHDKDKEIPDDLHDRMKAFLDFDSLPRIRSKELEGISGELKQNDDFFNVQEIPLWEPDNNGTNCIAVIRRKGATTKAVQEKLASLFGCKNFHIGYAGMKDKHATCTQTFSINVQNGLTKFDHVLSIEEIVNTIESNTDEPTLEVVGRPAFNSKKIRRGQLKGNIFKILITNLNVSIEEGLKRAHKTLSDLKTKAIPNYYGIQRVGKRGQSSIEGFRLLWKVQKYVTQQTENARLRKNKNVASSGFDGKLCNVDKSQTPPDKVEEVQEAELNETIQGDSRKRSRDDFDHEGLNVSKKKFRKWCKSCGMGSIESFGQKLKLNAFQSGVFNRMLAERINSNLFMEDLVGDLVMSQYGGKPKIKDTAEYFTDKTKYGSLTFTCPMIGKRVSSTTGKPKEIEDACLKEIGLSRTCFNLLGLDGSNRPGRLLVDSMGIEITKDIKERGILFSFTLPKGSYATSVIREFM